MEAKKKKGTPHTLVIIVILIFLATAATYIIPAGEFTRYEDPVSGETLVQAGSYVSTGTNPANPLHMPMLMYDGILDAADVIAFLLIIGGSFELVNASGAILALCRTVGRKLRGKEIFVVPIFLALFAVFGTTMGMSNEVAIFVPIGITMALTLGFARAIMLTLENAMVIDTIANAVSIAVNALPAAVQSIGFFLAQTGVSFVITSGSGMAAVTIPLMAPVADLIGLSRQALVLAYQMGDGFSNLLLPTTSSLLGALAVSKIPYARWVKFMFPLFLIWTALGAVMMVLAVAVGY